MLALAKYEASLCGGCQLPAAETFHIDNEYAYDASEPWICHACHAKHKGAQVWAKNNELTPAHRFVPERRSSG